MIDYLICDLMDLSKIKQGKFKKNLEKFDLRMMVKSVMAIQKKQAKEKGIKLYSDFS